MSLHSIFYLGSHATIALLLILRYPTHRFFIKYILPRNSLFFPSRAFISPLWATKALSTSHLLWNIIYPLSGAGAGFLTISQRSCQMAIMNMLILALASSRSNPVFSFGQLTMHRRYTMHKWLSGVVVAQVTCHACLELHQTCRVQ